MSRCSYCRDDLLSYIREFTCHQDRADPLVLDAIRTFVEKERVAIFVKPGCGFCVRTKALFSQHYPQVSVHSVIGSAHPYRIALARTLGVSAVSFPAVFIQGKYIGGADAVSKLHNSNMLFAATNKDRTPMAPIGTAMVKTKPVFFSQLAGSHAHVETDGPCDASTSRWYCFQTKSFAQVIRGMSFIHVAILILILLCGESNSLMALNVAAVVVVLFLVDLIMYVVFGATPLTVAGNVTTYFVWNFKGNAVPAVPYKVVWFVYILAIVRSITICNNYDNVQLCWLNNTVEYRVGLTSGIVNSGFLAVFRF